MSFLGVEDRDYLGLIVDTAPVAIVVADGKGTILLINEQGEQLFGYEKGELLGKSIEALVPDRYRRAHPMLRSGYHAAPTPRPMGAGRDLYALRQDGTEVPVEIGLNYASAHGRSIVLASVIDTTERKHAEDLRRQRDHALDASRLKSQFVATMSHELRTPLNAIIGMTELLNSTELGERQRTYVETINQSAEALLAIISSILDFSKIEAGKLDLDKRDFEVETVVEGAAGVIAQQARSKGLALHTYVDPLIPPKLRGDPDLLRQVLLNLIGNAVKFTEEGRVVVRALPLETSSRHARVRFEVQDTGIGISPEVIPNLFQPFVQGDSSASRSYGGTGLGLSIAKRLVELMGGDIGVSSGAGQGSLFWFDTRLERPTVTSAVRHIYGVRVLLVAADEVFSHIVSQYVQAWGMPVHRATDAADAVAKLQEMETSEDWIVIADADSPNAQTVFHTLAQVPALGPARVIMIGTNERLGKPIRQSLLFNRIAEVLIEPDAELAARLPAADASAIPPARTAAGKASSPTVLIVEDNRSLQDILIEQFAQLEVPAKIVSDGLQAVEAVRYERFSMVFMDCHMPKMDGYAATRAIRAAEQQTGDHVPIVAMTANAFKEDRDACLAAGMDDYLSKPVRMAGLREMTQRWMRSLEAEPT